MNARSLSKFSAPQLTHTLPRPRVRAEIKQAMRAGICWIAAPAGYGKTTAVADYVRHSKRPMLWYRVDAGDTDIASFFYHLSRALRTTRARVRLPVFGPEYADQPQSFARRFARDWLGALDSNTILVFDDAHEADQTLFNAVLGILLEELPIGAGCICVSRLLPPPCLDDLALHGRVAILDQQNLRFTDNEAQGLIRKRTRHNLPSLDLSLADGWAAALVMLAEQSGKNASSPATQGIQREKPFELLARCVIEQLPEAEQSLLERLCWMPHIDFELVQALALAAPSRALLNRLHARQLLLATDTAKRGFRMHDLLRDFLRAQQRSILSATHLRQQQCSVASALRRCGHTEAAIELALEAKAFDVATAWMMECAEVLLEQGRRLTVIEWISRLPEAELRHPGLCYWAGVAHLDDDAKAEAWFERAWHYFKEANDSSGAAMSAAHAVISKTDSWRTHSGLSIWTQRMLAQIDVDHAALRIHEQLLIGSGLIRAIEYSSEAPPNAQSIENLLNRILKLLMLSDSDATLNIRVLASAALLEYAGVNGRESAFRQAVDSVAADLRKPLLSRWVLGVWLVAFGTIRARYFDYQRQGFPHPDAESALRAALALGEQEGLRGVAFGALYHLQLQMKQQNRLEEFADLVQRIQACADHRFTTQTAVAADCMAALHTMQNDLPKAYTDCERFNAAIEAANEPPSERWPHYLTEFQVLLADRKAGPAADLLRRVVEHFHGETRRRTQICIDIANYFSACWNSGRQHEDGAARALLPALLQDLRESAWFAVLANLPALLAELCADALDHQIETAFLLELIRRRRLRVPDFRPACWPWPLRIRVLGQFELQRDGEVVAMGSKAPTRSLDILRMLAITRGHGLSLAHIHQHLWPDADGAQATAACDQALHRLRKLLNLPEAAIQRDGKLWLDLEQVWIDLDAWESAAAQARQNIADQPQRSIDVLRQFPGPLLHDEPERAWTLPAAERVRQKFLDLTLDAAHRAGQDKQFRQAQEIYLHALEHYPDSHRCYEGLLRQQLQLQDISSALETWRRYERMMHTLFQAPPAARIRTLMAPFLQQR
jgi:LuxR family transcriptional regulator, maltose regulon positive regulatory protein